MTFVTNDSPLNPGQLAFCVGRGSSALQRLASHVSPRRFSNLSKITGLIVVLGIVTTATADDRPLNVRPEGFQDLFNGKDLTGWKGQVGRPHERAAMRPEELAEAQRAADQRMRDHWAVEDGVLAFDGKGDSLCTAKDYSDFEMYADWKILPEGDSGIFVRGLPQIQIWDARHTNVGSGGLYNNQRHPSRPLVLADNPTGQWNTFYIKMVGNQVTVKLNGQLVVDNVELENLSEPNKPVYATGQIELQNHGNKLWFRNLFIRELTTADEVSSIQKEIPKKVRITPQKDRKVLVFTRAVGFRHRSIPHGAHAVQLMGQQTGAYKAVISDDLLMFLPSTLQQFDAVVLSNTTGSWIKPTEEDMKRFAPDGGRDTEAVEKMLRDSLLDFVAGGKGLAGFHSASDANYHWPEFGQLLGGIFVQHPWHETVGIQVERPDHPLSQAFRGDAFSIADEIYEFRDPYSRDHVQVLLSLDPKKTNMNKDRIQRTDGDFAVAWIRQHGKGRIFYSSLGHREEIFWNPDILQFYLDGLQFVLGDLDADATPSSQIAPGK